MAIQKRNDELVDLLRADFQPRYEMNFAWANACGMFLMLPGLTGLWPMGPFNTSGNARDISGNNLPLTDFNGPVYGLDLTTARCLAPYIALDGASYLYAADTASFDITGTETHVASQATTAGAARGLTMGGWFYPTDNTNDQTVFSKWDAAGNERSYNLSVMGSVANDPVRFYISDDGTNTSYVSSTVTTSMSTWQFMAGRFNDADTGAELAVWVNDTKTTDTTTRASIHSGTANLLVGGQHGGASLYTGRASLCFLCGAALPDVVLFALYHQTRALFGV